MNYLMKNENENEINLINQDGEILVSSKEVAEHFGKRHDNIMVSINKIKEDVLNFKEMFFEHNLPDTYGRKQKAYLMNRDGFTLLAMGFTGKKAMEWKLKYINAFNEMEKQLNSPELQIARALVTANKLLEIKNEEIRLLNENIEDQVKLLALAMGNSDRYIVSDIAKFYDMSAMRFNQLLHNLKIQKKIGGKWVLAKKYSDMPYVVSTTKKRYNDKHEVVQKIDFNAWTNDGLKFLYETLKLNGYHPNVEQGGM